MKVHIYRLRDADGRLLYVGMSKNVVARLANHSRMTPWWFRVAEIDLQAIEPGKDARAFERAAIRAERPIYNRQHNSRSHA